MTAAATLQRWQFTADLLGSNVESGEPVFVIGGECVAVVRDHEAKRTSPWMRHPNGDTINIVVTVSRDRAIDIDTSELA